MYIGPTSDQLKMRDAFRGLLSDLCTPAAVRATWNSDVGSTPEAGIWARLAEIGFLGLLAPEQMNGMGGNEVDLALLMTECGRFAVPGPLIEHVAVGVPVLSAAGRPEAREAADGTIVVTARPVYANRVPFMDIADLCLVVGDNISLASREDVTLGCRVDTVDRSWRTYNADFRRSLPLGVADAGRIADRATLAVAAQLLGLADQMLRLTVEYVKVRKQFDAVIGSQQAVKHYLATALIALEHARPVVFHAAAAMANRDPHSPRDVSFAKVYAHRAAHLMARVGLQCHGAIGYTWEHDLQLWMKRVWVLAPAWGTVAEHERRVADAVIGAT